MIILSLTNRPNKTLTEFLINGFRFGFDIGYRGPLTPGSTRNLLSAHSNPIPVTEALSKELVRGHTAGPFSSPPLPNFHCSPLGVVPKKDGTFRIILDLSSPKGSSINDGISKENYSVRYSSFDEAVDLVFRLGPDCQMAKLDIKHAFRLCPVRQEDFCLLGMFWNNFYFVDTRLPFGSRSSPFIFNQFADALAWILIFVFNIPYILHYLDDFFLVAPAKSSPSCQDFMDSAINAFNHLGVPLAPDKIVGPTTKLTYLGIEIDSSEGIIRLPLDKFTELQSTIALWVTRRKCTKRELLSLIGSLSFAAKVVKPGRIFLRRLIDLSKSVKELHYHILLNAEARKDIMWWSEFIGQWNGTSLMQSPPVAADALSLYTDASGTLGFGAVFNNLWFSSKWPPHLIHHDINYKELFTIFVALHTWKAHWFNKQIIFLTDNKSICDVWRSGSCSDSDIMNLIRKLFFFSAKNNVNILIHHIPGHFNILADCLSRLQIQQFFQHQPLASPIPSEIPPVVWLT